MRIKSVLSALGIACALVIGLDYVSFAATGQSVVLGKLNKANKVTTIQRTTNGPAASFVTKPGQAPFAVTRNTKVPRLNADLLDGKDSVALGTNTREYRFTIAQANADGSHYLVVPGTLPAGKWLATYAVSFAGLTGTPGAPITAYCEFVQNPVAGRFHNTAFASTAVTGSTSTGLSGSTVLDTANGNALRVFCSSSSGSWYTPAGFTLLGTTFDPMPAQVTLTKIDTHTLGTGTVARTQARTLGR